MNEGHRRSSWSRYWASGALHSLAGSFPGNYQGAIRAFWAECFAALSAADRVLDLGTGNGAIPLLLFELLPRGRWPAVEAVDLAEPRPEWLQRLPGAPVRFHAGVRIEALPHPGAHFSLVCAQFALEYAERDEALAECARVLAPSARLAAVLHHADSVLARVAREEREHLDWLLGESGLEQALCAALPFAAGATGDGEKARAGLNAELAALSRRIEEAEVPEVLIAAGKAALAAVEQARRAGIEAGASLWAGFRGELEAAALRAGELVARALDPEQVAAWQQALAGFGLMVERFSPLAEADGRLLGWALVAKRRAQKSSTC
jgi:SAM-dependent methyltransferase